MHEIKQSQPSIASRALAYCHRKLLRFRCYQRIVLACGFDSLVSKRYYRYITELATAQMRDFEVDGAHDHPSPDVVRDFVNLLRAQIPKQPARILDIGCGSGRYMQEMSVSWPNATLAGADISENIVNTYAKPRLPHAKFYIIDIEKERDFIHIPTKSFDLITMIGIVQVISRKSLPKIFERVFTLLDQGGTFYLQFNTESESCKSAVGYARYSPEYMKQILELSRFEKIHVRKTDLLPNFILMTARKL